MSSMANHDHEHEDPNLDRGLAFDLATVMSRRRVLGILAASSVVLLAGCKAVGSNGTVTSTTTALSDSSEIPDETAGPYPGDGSNGPNVLDDSGIVRSDIRTSFDGASGVAEGIPTQLELTLLNMDNAYSPFADAAVYVWHCDREGRYSMYSDGVENENYLRGVQVADTDGKVRFTTIFPACYSGRWPHIHFEVYKTVEEATGGGEPISTSQVALPQNVCEAVYATAGYSSSIRNLSQLTLASDNVFGDDGGVHQLATVSGSIAGGYSVALNVPISEATAATSQSMGGGRPPSR